MALPNPLCFFSLHTLCAIGYRALHTSGYFILSCTLFGPLLFCPNSFLYLPSFICPRSFATLTCCSVFHQNFHRFQCDGNHGRLHKNVILSTTQGLNLSGHPFEHAVDLVPYQPPLGTSEPDFQLFERTHQHVPRSDQSTNRVGRDARHLRPWQSFHLLRQTGFGVWGGWDWNK